MSSLPPKPPSQPKLTRAEFDQLLQRYRARGNRPSDEDEVALSKATSIGVEGMSADEVADAFKVPPLVENEPDGGLNKDATTAVSKLNAPMRRDEFARALEAAAQDGPDVGSRP